MHRKLVLSLVLCYMSALSAVTLVSDGKAKAVVVLPDEALPVQNLAAEELVYHITKATGAQLPVYAESKAPAAENFVYIGPCRKTAAAGIDHKKLAPAEFRILAQGNKLFICGSDNNSGRIGSSWAAVRHGTLWGVYDLLRTELGIRWLWPGELGEYVPARKEIKFTTLDRSRKPALQHTAFQGLKHKKMRFDFKETAAFYKAQARFALRHRLGAVKIVRAGHDFTDYWKLYGKTHPEYFAFIPPGGRKPLPGNESGRFIDLCLSSPALHRRIVKNHFAENKNGALDLTVSLNDTPILCRCDKCRSWDAPDPAFATNTYWNGKRLLVSKNRFSVSFTGWGEDGSSSVERNPSASDRFCRFVNEVMKLAKKRDPKIKAVGMAYANYTDAPVREKVSDLLLVHVTGHWFPFTEKMSKKFRKQMIDWKNAGVKEFIYRPNLTHAGANLPIFYARDFAKDFQFGVQNGVIGASLDALLGAYAVQGPTLYTIFRLLDDPAASVDDILNEYYSCFGPVKNEVRTYFEFWEKHAEKIKNFDMRKICNEERVNERPGGTFKNYSLIAHRLFPLKDLQAAGKILDAAWKKSGSDPLARKRVEFLQKGLRNAELTVKARLAQVKFLKNKTPENRKDFRKAIQKLYQQRVETAPDFIANHAYFFMRETHGCQWPMPQMPKMKKAAKK